LDDDDASGSIRVAVADDSFLMREAMRQVLARLPEIEVVEICDHGERLLDVVDRENPAVVITDVRMPPSGDDEGIRIAHRLRRTHPEVGVVVLSQYSDARYGLGLLEHGAEGRAYLLKERVADPAELRAAIDVVARGGSLIDPEMVHALMSAAGRGDSPLAQLTARESEVLAEMAQGKSNAAIAETLVLSKRAVEKHVGAIFLRLGLTDEEVVSRRVAAVLLYLGEHDQRPLQTPDGRGVAPGGGAGSA
jgi:DNA-binding NarL/FixJ family response regulator